MAFERNGHHIIHHAREWNLRPEGKSIRDTKTLIIPMEREHHVLIHDNVPAVPLLGYHALMRTRSSFEEGDTPLESMENLMRAMEVAKKHERAHPIERQLAELAIWAIDLQRPYISEVTRPLKLVA